MNIKSALMAIALVELLTLAALGHYAHQLHQLQGRRSLLASKKSFSVSTAGNMSSAPGRAEQGAPSTNTGNHILMEAQEKQQQVQQGIQQLERQIREQQERFRKQQTAKSASDSAQEVSGIATSAKITDRNMIRDKSDVHDADDDDDDEQDDRKVQVGAEISTASANVVPKAIDHASTVSLAAEKVAAAGAGSQSSQNLLGSFLPSPGSSGSSPSSTSSRDGERARVQGAGDYEVLWHDGKLHARQFQFKEAAYSFYDTIGSDTAHRLSYQGVEVKRLVWADGPWPSEWLPASSLPSAPSVSLGRMGTGEGVVEGRGGAAIDAKAGSLPASSVSMLEGRGRGVAGRADTLIDTKGQQNALLHGVRNGMPMASVGVAGGGGDGWGLDRYRGMNPEGGQVRAQAGVLDGADRARSGQNRLAASGTAVGSAGVASLHNPVSDGGGGGQSLAGRGGGVARLDARGPRVSAERPDAATVGKVHRAPPGQYVQRTEARVGGGEVRSDDVSISTHLSCDRIDRLESYFRRWPGPIVAALYMKDGGKDEARVDRLEKLLRATRRDNYHFLLVYPTDATLYPANLLRNVALEPVTTTMVFLLDIDLIPDVGFYPYVKSQYSKLVELSDSHVFTIPAFQGLGTVASVEAEFPVDKEDLVKMVAESKVKPILSGQEEFWEAFKCLNYDKWYGATEMYLADYRWPCEPYLLGMTSKMPLYDERFVHYGNDKAQHVLNIFYKQYRFGVLPGHFLLHWTHALAEWADDKKRNAHMGEIMELTEQFKFESGTEAGVNWHTGIKFAPGTYRVKNGVKIVWNGKEWVDESSGRATDPL